MILNRLSILMAERGLKITKISKDIGIARSTLTAINQNEVKMIQLETINKLCNYLTVEPKDFFSYIPYDFEFFVDIFKESNDNNSFVLEFEAYIRVFNSDIKEIAYIPYSGKSQNKNTSKSEITMHSACLSIDKEKTSISKAEIIETLPIEFKTTIKKNFEEYIEKESYNLFKNDNFLINVNVDLY